MQWFLQNELRPAHRQFYVFLVDATDGITAEIGEAGGQPQISTNGAGFVNTSGVLVSIGNGSYYVALTQAEVNTLGYILVRYKSANTAEFQALGAVVPQEWFLPK